MRTISRDEGSTRVGWGGGEAMTAGGRRTSDWTSSGYIYCTIYHLPAVSPLVWSPGHRHPRLAVKCNRSLPLVPHLASTSSSRTCQPQEIRHTDTYTRDPDSAISFDAPHLSPMASSSALPPLSSRSFLVLYASQTGTAVDISHRIARRGRREGWSVAVQDVATFDQVRPPPPRVPRLELIW